MGQRKKLIGLLKSPHKAEQLRQMGVCIGNYEDDCIEAMTADYLLANGVIAPPYKVGSEVYFADHDNNIALNGNVVSYSLDAAHLWFNCHYKCGLNIWHPIEGFGKTVFLTREEAEKALEERSKQ